MFSGGIFRAHARGGAPGLGARQSPYVVLTTVTQRGVRSAGTSRTSGSGYCELLKGKKLPQWPYHDRYCLRKQGTRGSNQIARSLSLSLSLSLVLALAPSLSLSRALALSASPRPQNEQFSNHSNMYTLAKVNSAHVLPTVLVRWPHEMWSMPSTVLHRQLDTLSTLN